MDPEEERSRPVSALKILDPLSIAELELYIAELEREIARTRAVIEAKRQIRGGADSLFRR